MTVDAQILRALRGAGEGAVSGAELSQQLGISRAAIWARIEELRELGYDIQASPHEGYHLRSSPDLLHADDLLARLGNTKVIGRDIRVFQETTSTNDVVEKLARDGVKEGVAVFAESQTKGRGRLGRSWVSAKGKGLWFSVLLRPALHPQAATTLTIASGTALARALRNCAGIPTEIKWPNDILVRGKKVCGILTEMSAELDRIKHVILGIGVNVNFTPSDFPPELRAIATSMRIEQGKSLLRGDVAAEVLRELDADYARVVEGKFAEVAEEWEEHCGTLGKDVEIQIGHRSVRGRAESLDDDGALLLRTHHGHLERIVGGDVSVKK
jgi:BirA family transcriptional regulator, biotin operon repressor / biotin---[acetyl-CoA-carboxylase] ligase